MAKRKRHTTPPPPVTIVNYPFELRYYWRSYSPRRTWHVAILKPDTDYVQQARRGKMFWLRTDTQRGRMAATRTERWEQATGRKASWQADQHDD